ncbi:MAG: type IV pilus secretin PilQ [Oceanospirillaceae bacterium]|nr:type IV pilus secretin PilQ [Oceanospirillaceae bacterium]
MLVVACCLVTVQARAQSAMLKDSSFVALPGHKLEVRLEFDAPPPSPRAYSIDSPPRLVLDLFGATNDIGRRQLDIKTGAVDSLSLAETEGRLRVVANLNEMVGYDTYAEGNSLFLVFGGKAGLPVATTSAAPVAPTAAAPSRSGMPAVQGTRVQGIDFERLDGGHGRVLISMSDDKAGLDIVEEGNNVVVNLQGATLAGSLNQRVDVQDFATPVMFIDSMSSGRNTTILVKPGAAPYDYMAYQTGNQLVLDFKPITYAEDKRRQEERFPYSGEKIDLNFQDVEIRSVLQIIAEVAEMNLVVGDEVGGNITLRLKNVPWDQALDLVLKTNGLAKREVGNVMLIGSAQTIADRERAELEAQKQVQELAPLLTEFIQVDFRKASEMKSRVEEAKLVSERGFIMADDETNVLMVRETAAQIEEIRDTLRRFDVEVAQVLIEARIVSASADFQKDLGIRWGMAGVKTNGDSNYIIDGGSPSPTPQFTQGFPEENGTSNLMVDLGVTPQSSFVFSYLRPDFLLSAELSALQTEGKAEIVSQPKVITTNGKPGLVESGVQIPYQTVEDGEVNIEFEDATLKLEVTPQLNPGDRITLDLDITQDSVGAVLPNGEVSINTNQLRTTVNVADGDTVVLGGVFRNESVNNLSKTPFFGDIPVIKNFFRKRETSNTKTELLIFITPKLIRESLAVQ